MRLAAVFIEDQDRESGGYTVNFGGYKHYDVIVNEGICKINATDNSVFIENLFDQNETIVNVSAIVGENGSGKTSIIYQIIEYFNGVYRQGFSIWEEKKKIFLKDYALNIPINVFGMDSPEQQQLSFALDTIYYSPFLDYKLGAYGIDISADKYMERDLDNLHSTFDGNSNVIVSDRLKRSDYKRFIKFQQSDFIDIIASKFGVLTDDYYRVVFIRHKIDIDREKIQFENTPMEFRSFLNYLYSDIRKEYRDFNREFSSDSEQYELNKKQMKNLILMDLLCLLIRLMEHSNKYLLNGHFKNKERALKVQRGKLPPFEKLKYWLNNYKYSKGLEHPLPSKEVLEILGFLYNYIDRLEYNLEFNLLDWGKNKSLFFTEETLSILLNLNEKLLISLPRYYLENKTSKDGFVFQDLSNIQSFVSTEYSTRRLSSGETAMLNLYSRLYDFFRMNILITPIMEEKDYYLLFLDEPDLGYHPSWKVSFIESITDFCSHFFGSFGSKVQIVFSTHDALSLSDIPKTNIVYLERRQEQFPNVLNSAKDITDKKSFAANVTDLLSDSFFLKNGLMGNFAKNKIQEVIDNFNFNILRNEIQDLKIHKNLKIKDLINEKEKELEEIKDKFTIRESKYLKSVIEIVDEPLLKFKLEEMYNRAFPVELDKKMARKQIEDIARKSGLDVNFD
ncbi:hypothetical protein [Seonamhaeicola sp.]|uniref:AAA family ATPase n=1 Tax=Seonamhaeicola sp. TaxID=1912245 RepID=UPI00262B2AF1|nr:hypothetical protein [Seonamhaeicola sp.]